MVLTEGTCNTLTPTQIIRQSELRDLDQKCLNFLAAKCNFQWYEPNLKRILLTYHQDSEHVEFSIWKWCISPVLSNRDGMHL